MESANMNRFKLRTMAAGLSLVLLLSACTANDGVATSASESVPASTDASSSDPNAVSLADKTLDDIYGSQLGNYLNHQYYFEGEPVSMTESNFYFVDTFTELTQYAGYYYPATAEGFIDLSAAIDTTGMSEEMAQYSTYGDFFVAYSEQMLESSLIINKLAAEKGLELPAETLTQIDEILLAAILFEGHGGDQLIIMKGPGRRLGGQHELLNLIGHQIRGLTELSQTQHQSLFRDIKLADDQGLAAEGRIRVSHSSVGKACGKMGIIQNPDLHSELFGFIQDGIHIGPPFRTAEIRMGPALHTEGADMGIVNHMDIFPEGLLILSMLPEEGKNMVLFLTHQNSLN